MNPVYVWLAALAAFIVIEIATMGLTTIWFAGGALIALVLALLNTSFYVQLGAFLVISIVLLVCTRPLAVKFFNGKREKVLNSFCFVFYFGDLGGTYCSLPLRRVIP